MSRKDQPRQTSRQTTWTVTVYFTGGGSNRHDGLTKDQATKIEADALNNPAVSNASATQN